MYDIVVEKFTFAISSADEFLVYFHRKLRVIHSQWKLRRKLSRKSPISVIVIT